MFLQSQAQGQELPQNYDRPKFDAGLSFEATPVSGESAVSTEPGDFVLGGMKKCPQCEILWLRIAELEQFVQKQGLSLPPSNASSPRRKTDFRHQQQAQAEPSRNYSNPPANPEDQASPVPTPADAESSGREKRSGYEDDPFADIEPVVEAAKAAKTAGRVGISPMPQVLMSPDSPWRDPPTLKMGIEECNESVTSGDSTSTTGEPVESDGEECGDGLAELGEVPVSGFCAPLETISECVPLNEATASPGKFDIGKSPRRLLGRRSPGRHSSQPAAVLFEFANKTNSPTAKSSQPQQPTANPKAITVLQRGSKSPRKKTRSAKAQTAGFPSPRKKSRTAKAQTAGFPSPRKKSRAVPELHKRPVMNSKARPAVPHEAPSPKAQEPATSPKHLSATSPKNQPTTSDEDCLIEDLPTAPPSTVKWRHAVSEPANFGRAFLPIPERKPPQRRASYDDDPVFVAPGELSLCRSSSEKSLKIPLSPCLPSRRTSWNAWRLQAAKTEQAQKIFHLDHLDQPDEKSEWRKPSTPPPSPKEDSLTPTEPDGAPKGLSLQPSESNRSRFSACSSTRANQSDTDYSEQFVFEEEEEDVGTSPLLNPPNPGSVSLKLDSTCATAGLGSTADLKKLNVTFSGMSRNGSLSSMSSSVVGPGKETFL